MIYKTFEYCDYTVEIHEHPVYHDFEYVIKDSKGSVKSASNHSYAECDDAENAAKINIKLL
jgi:hypothetical protein